MFSDLAEAWEMVCNAWPGGLADPPPPAADEGNPAALTRILEPTV